MNPKAAYLALHGLRPMVIPEYGSSPRIRRHAEHHEVQLQYNINARWVIHKGAEKSLYVTIDWEDITDTQYDALPQELIDKFLETY